MAHQIANELRSLIREYQQRTLELAHLAQYVEACGDNLGNGQAGAGRELKSLAIQLSLHSIHGEEANEVEAAVRRLLLRVGAIADLLDCTA